ncbi:MAG TPA: DinB family protein [Acidimicrobiales bacterium]|nr:DinB family protein [Acidimicrobiales bacterium]
MVDPLGVSQQIDEATERFVVELVGVDSRAWTTRPEPDRWSLSEVLEHVALVNRNVVGRLDALGPIDTTPDITDEEMPYLFYNAVEPPNVARPSGTWTDVDEGVQQLRASASALVAWADAATVDLRSHGFPHPAFGVLDGAQWLRFSAVHTWRHRSELLAVRRSIG